jgi:hypothetical protein
MPLEQVELALRKATPRRVNARGHGTEGVTSMRVKSTTLEDRLWSRVVEADDLSPNGWSGCWLWTGGKAAGGYGYMHFGRIDGRKVQRGTHVIAYELVIGLVPAGLVLDHLCRRLACCNPAHLEPVTNRENLRRGVGNQNVGKTHCKRGHPLSGDNLRIERSGSRRCRACWYETRRRYRARLKAERKDA